MYHMFTIGDIAISMVGLGIIIFIGTVAGVIRKKTSSYTILNFDSFFIRLPIIVLCSYLAGTWSWYVINQLVLFPTSFEQILLYISPSGRNFSLLGLFIGGILGFWSFLSRQPNEHRALRVDIFFEAICVGMIPLGIFLVLGDSFIGMPTQGILGISAIQSDSKLALYNSVLPIGFGISLIGMIGYGISLLFRHKRMHGYGYLGFSIITLSIGFLTIYQNYARRIITVIAGMRLDIKQYILFLIALLFLVLWYRSRKQWNKT